MRSVRGAVGVVGELCITAGVLLLLFVVWQLGFVAVVEGHKQADTVSALEKDFGGVPHPTTTGTGTGPAQPAQPQEQQQPPITTADLAYGQAWGILRIPRLGPTWSKPIYEGVGLDVLAEGLGHYQGTNLPGEVGNIAIAGHRAGHGNPLIDIDAIQDGDLMVIETREAYFVYKVDRHEIVLPTDVAVIAPVPEKPGETPTERHFTLTSCNPRYGSSHRYIVFSTFVEKIPHPKGLPASVMADPSTAA
ncbi:MAG: class E sortase [Lapillicoccus sp.]